MNDQPSERATKHPAIAQHGTQSGGEPGAVVVLGNEKGGTGKLIAAMHLAVALLRDGRSMASVDLDGRQSTHTRYIENRRWPGCRLELFAD